MASMTPLKRPPHALRLVREMVDLTQSEMASVLGCGEPTVRAIEAGRLKLSAKFAARLAGQTGLDADQLMRNELDPLPSPAEVRKHFSQAQQRNGRVDFSPGGRVSQNLPHALILRAAVLLGLIADELGPDGCLHTGFYDTLQKMTAKSLWKIPNSKTRHRVFQRSRDMGNEEIAEYVKRAAEALKVVTAAAHSSTKKRR